MTKVENNIFARVLPVTKTDKEDNENAVIEELFTLMGIMPLPQNKEKIRTYLNKWEPLNSTNAGDIKGSAEAAIQWEVVLQLLAKSNRLQLSTARENPLVKLVPFSYNFVLHFPVIKPETAYKLSRFAYFRRDNDKDFIVQSPKGFSKIFLMRPEALGMFYKLSEGVSIQSLVESNAGTDANEIRSFILFLLMESIVEPCDNDGTINEDHNDVFRQWDFHDLLFHSQSRLGRNEGPIGGSFRFKNIIKPQPAVKPKFTDRPFIPLPKPDLPSLITTDPTLTSVIEARRSIRTHNYIPISIEQLGHFLYRTCRVMNQFQTEIGEFTRRPYPSGGASYELEIYVTVDRCLGLERGVYYYDPVNHGLHHVADPSLDMELLLHEAWTSTGMSCRTQILFTITSRFQRVSWKYKGIAYAAQLKNIGVLYANMYLAATAMRLAPCALGLGNSDRFCKISGASYYEEGSIGEFMLGSPMPGA